MSWQDDIENKVFTIKTGDGYTYSPKWKNANKEVDYNVSVFDFVNVFGSFVDRRKPKARKFDLEFYFDGETAITVGNNFEISARDQRRWTVTHPFYGEIKCQPISLFQDNTALNCSTFRVPVLETLLQGWPVADVVISDQLQQLNITLNNNQLASLQIANITPLELKSTITVVNNVVGKEIKDSNQLADFKKLVSTTITSVDKVEFDIVTALTDVQAIINYPATIMQTVKDRLNILIEVATGIINSFDTTLFDKKRIEGMAGAAIAAMHIAASENIKNDYQTRNDVSDIMAMMQTAYQNYLTWLDSQQTDRADSDISYEPDFNSLSNLDNLVNLSLANLYQVAFGAKQERSIILEKDSNPALLAHRFYGLDLNDVKLNEFINQNNIGLNELLNIRKGRKVVYYV